MDFWLPWKPLDPKGMPKTHSISLRFYGFAWLGCMLKLEKTLKTLQNDRHFGHTSPERGAKNHSNSLGI